MLDEADERWIGEHGFSIPPRGSARPASHRLASLLQLRRESGCHYVDVPLPSGCSVERPAVITRDYDDSTSPLELMKYALPQCRTYSPPRIQSRASSMSSSSASSTPTTVSWRWDGNGTTA
jgi:hypothetical protein